MREVSGLVHGKEVVAGDEVDASALGSIALFEKEFSTVNALSCEVSLDFGVDFVVLVETELVALVEVGPELE